MEIDVNDQVVKYKTQQVMNASPAKLIAMLYDKAILSLKKAIAAIEAGEIEARWKANAKATEIISHMWSTLDLEKGGEIAKNLEGLFSFMMSRLAEVDFKNDPAPALEVIELLEPLRQSWHRVARGDTEGAAVAAGTPGNAVPAKGNSNPLSSGPISA